MESCLLLNMRLENIEILQLEKACRYDLNIHGHIVYKAKEIVLNKY
jgi:hypothetical protein